MDVSGNSVPGAQETPTIDAAEIARMVRGSTDEELERGFEANRKLILDEIFRRMSEHLRRDRAARLNAVIEWRIRDAAGGYDRWQVSIRDGVCTTTRDGDERPRTVFTLGPVDFLKLVTGNATGPQLFLFGRLKIERDLVFAARVPGLFSIPRA